MEKKGVKNNFFCIKPINRSKLDYKGNVQLESLNDYLEHARKLIKHLSRPGFSGEKTSAYNMVCNEDAVSHVAHYIMLADMAYDPNRNTKLSTLRVKYAYYAILDIYRISKLKKNKPRLLIKEDIEYNEKDIDFSDNLEEISHYINHSGLTKREKSILVDYYINGKRGLAITKEYSLSREGIRFIIKKCISKIRSKHLTRNNNDKSISEETK